MNYIIASAAIAISPTYCDRRTVLVDQELLKFLQLGSLCKVQLVTEELELDAYDMPVPKDWKVIELMILDDSRETIELLVASTPEYQGYKVVDRGQVIDDVQPF